MGRRRKGVFRGPRFAALYDWEMDLPAYQHLSVYGRALLMEFRIAFNGYNNAKVGMSVRRAADRLNCSPGRAEKAIRELEAKGWTVCTQKGSFSQKSGKRATTWRLTNEPIGAGLDVPATKEYTRWRPDKGLPEKSERGAV